MEEVARSHGVLLISASSDEDPARERQVIMLVDRRVDGLLVVPAGSDHRYLRQDIDRGLGVVFVDRPPMRLAADTVALDNVGGARTAVSHLVAHGHRRIALLSDRRDVYTIGERYAGYHAAMDEAGVQVDETLVRFGCHDTADAEQAVRELLALPHPPTAIFATNNRMAVGAVQALAATGTRLALVGFRRLRAGRRPGDARDRDRLRPSADGPAGGRAALRADGSTGRAPPARDAAHLPHQAWLGARSPSATCDSRPRRARRSLTRS